VSQVGWAKAKPHTLRHGGASIGLTKASACAAAKKKFTSNTIR